jgi:hypothetical protein
VAGLIVLTRHTNVLFLLFLPLYGLRGPDAVGARFALFGRNLRLLAVIAGVAAIVVAPQLAIYYQATGRPIVSSYGDLGFNFGSPRIVGVLFSVRKGLFFWSPLLLTACAGMIGLARSRHSARAFVLPSALFLTANTYVIASWWDWQFGGSFGHRGFVDALPVFAIGMAAFYEWTAGSHARRAIVMSVVALAIALNLFQMLQYWNGVLPFSDTTWDQYRGIFLQWR